MHGKFNFSECWFSKNLFYLFFCSVPQKQSMVQSVRVYVRVYVCVCVCVFVCMYVGMNDKCRFNIILICNIPQLQV